VPVLLDRSSKERKRLKRYDSVLTDRLIVEGEGRRRQQRRKRAEEGDRKGTSVYDSTSKVSDLRHRVELDLLGVEVVLGDDHGLVGGHVLEYL
jgi:ribosomal protein L32